MNRVLIGLALALMLGLVGAVAGGLLAALTVDEEGLAAAGTVFFYLAIGAGLGVIAGGVLAARLPRERLRPVLWIALVGALLAAAFVGARLWWLWAHEPASVESAPRSPTVPAPEAQPVSPP